MLEAAPWMIVGFILAGVVRVLLPNSLIRRHLTAPGFKSVFKAAALGIPLPLCSCSVIPLASELRRQKASKGATAAFFISTPEIGIDSFILTWTLLSPALAIWRAVAAFISALLAGGLIDRFCEEQTAVKKSSSLLKLAPEEHTHDHSKSINLAPSSTFSKITYYIRKIIHFSFVDTVDDLVVPLTVGFILSGLLSALLPPDFFLSQGLSNLTIMLVMLLISLPLYICAVASTPLAAALVQKGLSQGSALVLLLAGPASNISTMAVIKRELGMKSLMIYLLSVGSVSLICGMLLDNMADLSLFIPPKFDHEHVHEGIVANLAALFLFGMLVRSLIRKIQSKHCHHPEEGALSCCGH